MLFTLSGHPNTAAYAEAAYAIIGGIINGDDPLSLACKGDEALKREMGPHGTMNT